MSADNWTYCPKCRADVQSDTERRVAKADQSYGKVSAEEYLKLRQQSEAKPALDQTFREDYEIGMGKDGDFYVIYSGSCGVCKCGFKFRHEEKVNLEASK